MARVAHFDPRTLLKQIAIPLLQKFFEQRGELLDLPWKELREKKLITPICAAWQQLPEHSVVAAGYANCPDCGFAFPPPDRQPHETRASDAGMLSGQVTTTTYRVSDVYYGVHTKRGATEDDPKTMRVDFKVGWHEYKSEWVCFEHEG